VWPPFATCRHRPSASFVMALSSDCVAPRNVRPMAPSPRHCPTARQDDPCSAIGIQVEAAVVDRMRAMRGPGESYSEVILRLVELKTSDLK
jgi:hypothetical protein